MKKIPYGKLTTSPKVVITDLTVNIVLSIFFIFVLTIIFPPFFLLFLLVIFLVRKIVVASEAKYVFLDKDYLVVDKTIQIPLEQVSEIKYLGGFGRTSYGFKAVLDRNYPNLKGNSIVFMSPARVVLLQYAGQHNYRNAIMAAVNLKRRAVFS